MRAILEGFDTTLVERLGRHFQQHDWTAECEIGQELAAFVQARNPATPDDVIQVFLACFNRLMQGQATFRLLRWEEERKSEAFVDRRVVIELRGPEAVR